MQQCLPFVALPLHLFRPFIPLLFIVVVQAHLFDTSLISASLALAFIASVETLRPLLSDPRGPVRCAALLALLDLQWVPDQREFSKRSVSEKWGRNLQLVPDATLHELARDPHEPTSRVAQLGQIGRAHV